MINIESECPYLENELRGYIMLYEILKLSSYIIKPTMNQMDYTVRFNIL